MLAFFLVYPRYAQRRPDMAPVQRQGVPLGAKLRAFPISRRRGPRSRTRPAFMTPLALMRRLMPALVLLLTLASALLADLSSARPEQSL